MGTLDQIGSARTLIATPSARMFHTSHILGAIQPQGTYKDGNNMPWQYIRDMRAPSALVVITPVGLGNGR